MKKLNFLFFPTILALAFGLMLSCAKSSEDNINDGVAKTNQNLADTLEDNNDTAVDLENALSGGGGGGGGSSNSSSCNNKGSFQIHPEKGAGLWEIVKNKKDCGYALVGGKNRKPWIQVINENGNHLMSKTYDVFGNYKTSSIFIGNGFPAEGKLDGSAISQTKDGGYIVGTFVLPRHPSYGYSWIFKTDSQGEIEWKRELKYKSGKTKVIHFVEDIIQTNDGHYVAVGYTSGDNGNNVKGQGFVTKIDKDDGTEKWMKRFGSNACIFDTLKSVLEDNENNLIAIGKYEKPCPKYACHHGYACGDVYFLKINSATGETLISKRHAPNKWWASGNSILQLDDGSFIVGGKIRADKRKATNSAVWRFDQNGEMVWSKPWTGTGRIENKDSHLEIVFALALSPQRDAIIAAGQTKIVTSKKDNKGDMMAWSMDLNGTQKWIKRYEVPGWQTAADITQIKNNHFLLSGGGNSFFEIDSDGNLIKIHK